MAFVTIAFIDAAAACYMPSETGLREPLGFGTRRILAAR